MPSIVVHDMDSAWQSSAPALSVAVDPAVFVGTGPASNRFTATTAAVNATAAFNPAAPLDLGLFDELRFWILGDRAADGSSTSPFYLELFYVASSAPALEHRWFVPVNRAGQWEHHIVGFAASEPRGQLTRLAFRAITTLPFVCYVDELLAVREEMLPDAELALTAAVGGNLSLPGLTNLATVAPPNAGDTQVVVASTPGFNVGNRLRVSGSSVGDQSFNVRQVTTAGATTTLDFELGESLAGTFAGNALVSVVVPVVVETSVTPTAAPNPAVIVTMLDAREDSERTGYFLQRDSFREFGPLTVCSVRPAPRAYTVDYQITVRGTVRAQQLAVHDALLRRLSSDLGLRINGAVAPVWMVAPPALLERKLGELAPIYLRIGTHLQTAPRAEQTWVRRTEVRAAPLDAPLDWERVETTL